MELTEVTTNIVIDGEAIDNLVLEGEEVVVTEVDSVEIAEVTDGEYGTFNQVSHQEAYSGATTITPTREEQVLLTNGLLVRDNITINPIPSNYGLITWNGHTLTVS